MRTRSIRSFTGIGGGEVCDAENLLRLWKGSGEEPPLETVPGYRQEASFSGRIHGIYRYGTLTVQGKPVTFFAVHEGKNLHLLNDQGTVEASITGQLANQKSNAFRFRGRLYLLDGEGYYELSAYVGTSNRILPELKEVDSYTPTVYAEETPLESRNFYGTACTECLTVTDPRIYSVGSEGLIYTVTSETAREARLVSGGAAVGEVLIPACVRLNGVSYRVTEIGDGAFFMNTHITSVTVGAEVRRIGARAFLGCTALQRVLTNGAVETLEIYAFSRCYALLEVSFGEALKMIRRGAFHECKNLFTVKYGGISLFDEVTVEESGNEFLLSATLMQDTELPSVEPRQIRCPIMAEGSAVLSVKFGENELAESEGNVTYLAESKDGRISSILLTANEPAALYGKTLTVTLAGVTKHPDFSGDGRSLICGCRVGAVYDGRIFLGGNPRLPGTVFYSGGTLQGEMHPGYFGCYSYFRDGEAGAKTVGLTASPEGLFVFTSEDGGCGIYRHVGADSGSDVLPRIYPSDGGHRADGEYRASLLYRDEVLMLSSRGVSAICRRESGETALAPRDEGFPATAETSEDAGLGVWLGYLAVLDGERILLGDGRRVHRTASGGVRYEWWRLSQICGYIDDAPLYRYAEHLPSGAFEKGISLAPKALRGSRVSGTVIDSEGFLACAGEDGLYAVYDSGERIGGLKSSISAFLAEGEMLRFGCGCGKLYRFSTDKLGLPPSGSIAEYDAMGLRLFAERMPAYLSPEWYSFAGHAITSRLLTEPDDCGYPAQLKSTEAKSTVLECGTGRYTVTALTSEGKHSESGEVASAALDFAWLDFEAVTFADGEAAPTVFRENTKKWHRKQYLITASGVGCPLAVRGIGYLYTVVGKVKG